MSMSLANVTGCGVEKLSAQLIKWQPLLVVVASAKSEALLFSEDVIQVLFEVSNVLADWRKDVHHEVFVQEERDVFGNFLEGDFHEVVVVVSPMSNSPKSASASSWHFPASQRVGMQIAMRKMGSTCNMAMTSFNQG